MGPVSALEKDRPARNRGVKLKVRKKSKEEKDRERERERREREQMKAGMPKQFGFCHPLFHFSSP